MYFPRFPAGASSAQPGAFLLPVNVPGSTPWHLCSLYIKKLEIYILGPILGCIFASQRWFGHKHPTKGFVALCSPPKHTTILIYLMTFCSDWGIMETVAELTICSFLMSYSFLRIHFLYSFIVSVFYASSHMSLKSPLPHPMGWEFIAFHQIQTFALLLITAQFTVSIQIKAQDISQ